MKDTKIKAKIKKNPPKGGVCRLTRNLFNNNEIMKELKTDFVGIGEVRGFLFKQLHANGFAYVYEVKNPDEKNAHYEVFERVENTIFDCVSYPKSKSFGVWAWCVKDYDKAIEKYDEITKKVQERLLNQK